MSDRPPGWKRISTDSESCANCRYTVNLGHPRTFLTKAIGCHKYSKLLFWDIDQMKTWRCADYELSQDPYDDPAYGLE